jgi:hypothetical protein
MENKLIYTIRKPPEYSEWEVVICNWHYRIIKGHVPNRFHRKMQELCFGVKWIKI